MSNKKILVTGGAGFIGSHTCKQLLLHGFEPICYDNLSTGYIHNVRWGSFIEGDILDTKKFSETLEEIRPSAVMHFAAAAYVQESIINPELYYKNNVQGTISVLNGMKNYAAIPIVFSSTCATYGVPGLTPINEDCIQNPINPYGASKLMSERIIKDYGMAYGMRYAILRYFNASGADLDNELGEEHSPETHLIPRCLQAACGIIDYVDVFGDDYNTSDGTCVRDYIHVTDLAIGHVNSLEYLMKKSSSFEINLGAGRGVSIIEIINSIEKIIGKKVPFKIKPRRPGDPPSLFADISKARNLIDFYPSNSDLETIIKTAYNRYSDLCRSS
jgi:UDP-arabinose 4-epimerase